MHEKNNRCHLCSVIVRHTNCEHTKHQLSNFKTQITPLCLQANRDHEHWTISLGGVEAPSHWITTRFCHNLVQCKKTLYHNSRLDSPRSLWCKIKSLVASMSPPTLVDQYACTARTSLPHISPYSLSSSRDIETAQIKPSLSVINHMGYRRRSLDGGSKRGFRK